MLGRPLAASGLKVIWMRQEEQSEAKDLIAPTLTSDIVCERATISMWSQLLILIHRHALYTFYMLHGLRGMLLRNIVSGVLYGILYYRNGTYLYEQQLIVNPRTFEYK